MRSILTLILIGLFTVASAQQPGSFDWKYKHGYLSKAEIKANLCCPCDALRLQKLQWYSEKKGVTQRTDRQFFIIGKGYGYTPLTKADVTALANLIPNVPDYPKILLEPDLWRYPADMVQSIVDGYHEDLVYYAEQKGKFNEYVLQNYTIFKAWWVVSACDQWKVSGKSCVWIPYTGDLSDVYLSKLYGILSGAKTTGKDVTSKVNSPLRLSK